MPRILKDLRDSFIKYITLASKDDWWQHSSFDFKNWSVYIQINLFDDVFYSFIITVHPKEWPPSIEDEPQTIYQMSGSKWAASDEISFSIFTTRENHLVVKSEIKTPIKFKKNVFDELGLKLSDIGKLPVLFQLETVKMV